MNLRNYGIIGFAASFVTGELYATYIESLENAGVLEVTFGHLATLVGVMLLTLAGSIYPELERDTPLTLASGMEWGERFVKYGKGSRQNGIAHSIFNVAGSTAVPFGILYILALIFSWNCEWIIALGMSFMIGQVLHLTVDTFCDGVRWLLPLFKTNIRIPLIRNLFTESIVTLVVAGGLIYVAVMCIPGSLA